MQYRVKVYDITGAAGVTTLNDAVVSGWSKRINSGGAMGFWLPARSGSYTLEKLQKYRRVRLERKRRDGSGIWDNVWYGYMEAHKRVDSERIGVVCQGMLNYFKKRLTTNNQSFSGDGATDAYSLITATNLLNPTGITNLGGTIGSTRSVQMQGQVDIARAIEQLAQAHNAEYEITEAGVFRFVSLLGSDKSSIITLKFRRDGKPGNNLRDTQEGEDGAPMANQIFASSSTAGGYTWNDLVSQAKYGLLQEVKQFNEAGDMTTLQAMAGAYGSQRANPITDYQAIPIAAEKRFNVSTGTETVSGLQYGDVVPGDLVQAEIITENDTIEEARRVAEIEVNVDKNEHETMKYTLSKSGVFITSAYLDVNEFSDMKRRIRELEALV